MHFLDLPPDILLSLPPFLDSIRDLYHLLVTCQYCYRTIVASTTKLSFKGTNPQPQVHTLNVRSYLLLTQVAKQIGEWAARSTFNELILFSAVRDGPSCLLRLAESIAQITLRDWLGTHRLKEELLEPVSNAIKWDKALEFGKRWVLNPTQTVLDYVIYCELFSDFSNDNFSPWDSQAMMCKSIRHRFVAYCVPDGHSRRHFPCNYLGNEHQQQRDLQQFLTSKHFITMGQILSYFYKTGKFVSYTTVSTSMDQPSFNHDFQPMSSKESLFTFCASHWGWTTVQLFLEVYHEAENITCIEKLIALKEQIDRIPDEQVGNITAGRTENWKGLLNDIVDGFDTRYSEFTRARQDTMWQNQVVKRLKEDRERDINTGVDELTDYEDLVCHVWSSEVDITTREFYLALQKKLVESS